MAAAQPTQEDPNATGSDLEILQTIEKAWKRNNPTEFKRNSAKSMDWFRKYIGKSFNNMKTGVLFRDQKMWKPKVTMGKMYTYEYDALHKATLPIWDRYPMMIPFSAYKSKDGTPIIVGLNFHYLSPKMRMIAFSALLRFRNEKRYRKQTKFNFDWQVLTALAESKYFKHAVHAYRLDHVKSVFVEIPPQSWEIALFLPTARWVGGTSKDAWSL